MGPRLREERASEIVLLKQKDTADNEEFMLLTKHECKFTFTAFS